MISVLDLIELAQIVDMVTVAIAVLDVCHIGMLLTKLLTREHSLRRHWRLATFRAGHTMRDDDTFLISLDKAIRNDFFWCAARVTAGVGFAGELIGRWSEGCQCHEAELVSGHGHNVGVSCQMQGRRTAELAAGDAMARFHHLLAETKNDILPFISKLSELHRATMLSDWNKARAHIASQLELKLAHRQSLPYSLCALSHTDPATVVNAARYNLA